MAKNEKVSKKVMPLISTVSADAKINESFKKIKNNILLESKKSNNKSFMVVNDQYMSSNSITVANLAISCAQDNYKTIIVDANLRNPQQHKLFENANTKGLTDLVQDHLRMDQTIRKTNVHYLDLLTSGANTNNTTKILNSPKLKNIFQELSQFYDVVIVDVPEMNDYVDAQILAEKIGQVVIMINTEKNNLKSIKNMKEQITHTGANILGVILNKKTKK